MDVLIARSLKGEATAEEEEAVRRWRRASPENEGEYRELARLVEWAARIPEVVDVPARPTAAQLIRGGESEPRVLALPRRLSGPGGAWLAAAAAAVVVLGTFLHYYRSRGAHAGAPGFGIREIVTSQSETATLELLDGTVVRLAPSSRLQLLAGGGRREVMLEGRSFFAVAKRNGAAFVIRTKAGAVTVLGTRLDLEARGRDLRLVVVEGQVALSTAHGRRQLRAGEMGRIVNGENASVVRVPDVGALVEWTGDFLAFQSTPLGDAAREIERVYRVRVEIPDEALARRVITAWFRDQSLDQVLDVVCLAVAARWTIHDRLVHIVPDTASRLSPAVHGGRQS